MNEDTDIAAYIPVEDGAALLGLKLRKVQRYVEQGQIRTKQVGLQTLVHQGDVEALAAERRPAKPTTPTPPQAGLVPVDELLTYMRERDQQLEELQRQLREALAQNGYLRGQLDQRALPTDRDALQKRVAKLERQLELAQEPWWKKRLRRTLTS